jgi:type II secretory pathway pseudopilin PulG
MPITRHPNVTKNNGFSLLEILLVLVCMAAIITWSMHHFQQKQRRTQMIQIQSDVKSLQRAVNDYFHNTGCDSKGKYANDSLEISCQSLQQSGADIVCDRPPLVKQYSSRLILTDQKTQDNQPKFIYRLQVQADMNSHSTPSEIAWYIKELKANSSSGNNTLYWNSLPSNSYVELGDNAWILAGAGASFRARANENGAGSSPPPQYSGSNCAN